MFNFIKQAFIWLLGFSWSLAWNCMSLNDGSCLARYTPIDLNQNQLHCYPFMVRLERCHGRCNTLDDPSDRICVPYNPENINLNVFNMIKIINEKKHWQNIFHVTGNVNLMVENVT